VDCGGLNAWRDVGPCRWAGVPIAALEGLKGTGKEPGAIEIDRGCTCWCVFVKIRGVEVCVDELYTSNVRGTWGNGARPK
jgi:hypothetical protein